MTEKVLLVDDEKEFLEIMSERIKARGMEVTTTESADQALSLIEKSHLMPLSWIFRCRKWMGWKH